MSPAGVRVIAICLFRRDDRILVFEAFDSVKKSPYYRPLGGGVEPGEPTRETVRREIREELGQEAGGFDLLGVLENRFECDGKPGHEIVFVYDGRFKDVRVYGESKLRVVEDNGEVLTARWRAIDFFDDHHRLVPEGLFGLL